MIVRTVKLDDKDRFYDSCRTLISNIAEHAALGEEKSCLSPSDLLFFDIETTGLSPKEASIYLIGCLYENEEGPVLTQLFAESPSEEAQVISSFDTIVRSHGVLVHYNGSTFDVPFITVRAAACGISLYGLDRQIDIYRELKHLKSLFGLKSMRMKAVEEYAGIRRKDIYDGGELIELYIKYISLKKLKGLQNDPSHNSGINDDFPAPYCAGSGKIVSSFSDHTGLRRIGSEDMSELLRILLLHNYEDVENMLFITPLMEIAGFINGRFSVVRSEPSGCSLNITIRPGNSVVSDQFVAKILTSTRVRNGFHALTAGGDNMDVFCTVDSDGNITFSINASECELKFFFPDHKNYYYLIYEDYAVHKSIGQFMDRERCVKCTAANCYTRKKGIFVPVFEKKGGALCDRVYLYRRNAPDKSLFISIEDLIADNEIAKTFMLQLLAQIQ
ncbi:MAG: ribonuclease H-like domain-containing protein [Lachnospiraceae bacterium]|nr:ribonuclease H-like domain-containing protein [Lachnospiraceae bacterium]